MLVSQSPFLARERITTSRLAHPGVRRRARSRTYLKRCALSFSASSTRRGFSLRAYGYGTDWSMRDGVARRDQFGVRCRRSRYRQSTFAVHATCYSTSPRRVSRLRTRISADKGEHSLPHFSWSASLELHSWAPF